MQAYRVTRNGGFDDQHNSSEKVSTVVHARDEATARANGAAMLGTTASRVTAVAIDTPTLGTLER